MVYMARHLVTLVYYCSMYYIGSNLMHSIIASVDTMFYHMHLLWVMVMLIIAVHAIVMTDCPVCQDTLASDLTAISPCGHVFHGAWYGHSPLPYYPQCTHARINECYHIVFVNG